MSSGITFDDYREAREYQQMLALEGINSNIENKWGKYVVTQKGRSNIEMSTVPKEALGKGVGGSHIGYKEKHIIKLQPRASTRLKLHEIGHAKADHRSTGGLTTGDRIERELDAEIYAWQTQGKKPNFRVGVDILRQLLNPREGLWGGSTEGAFNEVARRLEKRGITVTRENKHELVDLIWTHAKDEEEAKDIQWLKDRL